MVADWCVLSFPRLEHRLRFPLLLSARPQISVSSLCSVESLTAAPPAGQTAEAVGDLDRAIAAYESALRHNAYSVVALSQIAAICRSREEFKKAAEYFGRVVGIAPESGDVWGALGQSRVVCALFSYAMREKGRGIRSPVRTDVCALSQDTATS